VTALSAFHTGVFYWS